MPNIVIAQGKPKDEVIVDVHHSRTAIPSSREKDIATTMNELWKIASMVANGLPPCDYEPQPGDYIILVDKHGSTWRIGIQCTNTIIYWDFPQETHWKHDKSYFESVVNSLNRQRVICPACGFSGRAGAVGNHIRKHVRAGEMVLVKPANEGEIRYFNDHKKQKYAVVSDDNPV